MLDIVVKSRGNLKAETKPLFPFSVFRSSPVPTGIMRKSQLISINPELSAGNLLSMHPPDNPYGPLRVIHGIMRTVAITGLPIPLELPGGCEDLRRQ
jgi:hypothetical protein